VELVDILPFAGDCDQLLAEFSVYQSSSDSELGIQDGQRVDAFWHQLSEKKNPATGKLLFPNLCELAMVVLLVPHSNAFCEGLFSMVRKIVTDQRSSLGRNKEGHSATSSYSQVAGLRNNLCGILAAKVNVFKSEGVQCHTWAPTKQLLKKAKSATYTALKK
jgi:hypothetical protein